MPVLDVHRDEEALTVALTAEFEAPPVRVWQVFADPRQLERWWGPPDWPATFDEHDFRVGGRATYYMTGPDGTRAHGWWQFTAIDEPRSLEFDDGFADQQGTPVPEPQPTHAVVTFAADGDRTRMTVRSAFTSLDALHQQARMGMEDGLRLAAGQIDAILKEQP
ncbi:SRPBCC domain-containing protein [Actinoplanes bogorensis]|uniref:SRPBCC domain-containing protein n=1 Tax=Paractinoplanes bogorensis TaxID=1610840 RepID=A0ABS5YP85_9ACTN|nr:SRPBCC domain-containing protein [Actinoplanes bogorensis]MBU2664534.1 SRPBCC domain-containing protein [Actinoplanes bogorensis]